MSRTLRRLSDKKRNKSGRSNFEKSYTYDRDEPQFFVQGRAWCSIKLVKLTGTEFSKQYWKFHGDTNPGYGWGNHPADRHRFEQRCRMSNKTELARWLKDPDHEVVVHQPGCLSWER